MNAIETTKSLIENLPGVSATELRKMAPQFGLKGMSSARKADIIAAITEVLNAQIFEAEREAELAAIEAESKPNPVATKRGFCTECGRKEDFRGSGLCEADRTYGEWENNHSDEGHGQEGGNADGATPNDCWVCHPELDERKAKRPQAGSSKAGMVVHAKGDISAKVAVVREAAEARGLKVLAETLKHEYRLVATGDGFELTVTWDGHGRYDYPKSGALVAGKVRKVRNVSEALRLING